MLYKYPGKQKLLFPWEWLGIALGNTIPRGGGRRGGGSTEQPPPTPFSTPMNLEKFTLQLPFYFGNALRNRGETEAGVPCSNPQPPQQPLPTCMGQGQHQGCAFPCTSHAPCQGHDEDTDGICLQFLPARCHQRLGPCPAQLWDPGWATFPSEPPVLRGWFLLAPSAPEPRGTWGYFERWRCWPWQAVMVWLSAHFQPRLHFWLWGMEVPRPASLAFGSGSPNQPPVPVPLSPLSGCITWGSAQVPPNPWIWGQEGPPEGAQSF